MRRRDLHLALFASLTLAAGCSFGVDDSRRASSSDLAAITNPVSDDAAGTLASASSNAFEGGSTNGFFTNLGSNGRTCGTCHVQADAWTVTPADAAARPANDPLFAPVDGSDCPPTSATQGADKSRSTMMTQYGLVRVQIAPPPGADFRIADASNPKHCAVAPGTTAIGNQLFLFRRPLPSTNLGGLSTVMWDGRETLQKITTTAPLANLGPLTFDLSDQANGATVGHAQATQSIVGAQSQRDIVAFELGLATAQASVGGVDLASADANGGAGFLLAQVLPAFFIGQNDPLAPGFTSTIFTIYAAWEPGPDGVTPPTLSPTQAAIGRGEKLFNTRTFTIANVAGLNSAADDPLFNPADPLANTPFTGSCGTCHDAPNLGNHSTSFPINIGIAMKKPRNNANRGIDGILDTANLPVYDVRGPKGAEASVTDPGRALVTGRFVDVGKTKGPILRGLAARAPYFHNGSAKDLATVVAFYDARFGIGLSAGEKSDLVAFLTAL